MGSAIQRFLGSTEPVEARAWLKWPPLAATGTALKECQWPTEAAWAKCMNGGLRSDHRQNSPECLWLSPRIAHCRAESQRPLFERAGHLSTEHRVPRSNHWQVELRANG